jgi:hypothetical protein
MQGLSIKSLLVFLVLFLILQGGVIFLYRFLENEIPTPKNWSPDIKIYRKVIGGETRVVENKHGRVLFNHLPEYDGHVHPISIQKIDETHWQVVFEEPKSQN